MAREFDVKQSRLLDKTSKLREQLQSRSLYTPEMQYPNTDDSTVGKIVKSISSVIDVIAPFKSYNIDNSVVGRLLTDRTPLSKISLVMLSKQFMYNTMSHVARENLPEIRPSNLWDGNKDTGLFVFRKEMEITKTEPKTFGEKISNFLDNIIYYYPNNKTPFNSESTNADYINNTGKGQLQVLYKNINRNQYKQDENTLYSKANELDINITSRIDVIRRSKIKYYSGLITNNPYSNINYNNISVELSGLIYSESKLIGDFKEYAPNIDYVRNNMGVTNKSGNDIYNPNDWVSNDDSGFKYDGYNNKLVWGRDGISSNVIKNDVIGSTDRDIEFLSNVNDNVDFSINESDTKFNIKTGLLEYTRNLLNASDGQLIDNTKKVFKKNNKIVGFNGSPLFKVNESEYTKGSNISGVSGIRQHTSYDQYDRYAKAIRYNGNSLYGGSSNSVINNSVVPQVNPKYTGDGYDTRKLMFSIENLAFKVNDDGSFYNDAVPLSEVGINGGRVMWFPPYGITINETSNAKYESTVMIGRNEPMYNYMNTERSATISFKLLVDYPEQLKNLRYQGDNKHKEIADFFAFGGDKFNPKDGNIPSLELVINEKKTRISELKNSDSKPPILPVDQSFDRIDVFFPNDEPNSGNITTIFNKMYNELQYEIIEGIVVNENDKTIRFGGSNGLNKDIFLPIGIDDVTGQILPEYNPVYEYHDVGFSPYNYDIGNNGESKLDMELSRLLSDVNNKGLYEIILVSHASKLYEIENKREKYNSELGLRRANAVKHLITERAKVLYGDINDFISGFVIRNAGDSQASFELADVDDMYTDKGKLERRVEIYIKRNNLTRENTESTLSTEELDELNQIEEDLVEYETKLNLIKKYQNFNNSFFYENTDGILSGFKSISGNKYYPAFHSQTPEDFHRRLTFLHQCTRQGASINKSSENDGLIKNSVFGRQPICILRIGDFIYSKIIIESVNFDFEEPIWDLNPEGFGLQPMIGNITLNIKIIGGQSLQGPINALQNAISFNYYANSTFRDSDVNRIAVRAEKNQYGEVDNKDENNKK